VRNLAHLAELVSTAPGPYLRFDCEYREAVVVDAAAAVAETAAVRRRARLCVLGGGGRAREVSGQSNARARLLARTRRTHAHALEPYPDAARPWQVLEAHGIPAALSADLREGLPQWPPSQASSNGRPPAAAAAAAAAAGA
jgi:hypothetical protein